MKQPLGRAALTLHERAASPTRLRTGRSSSYLVRISGAVRKHHNAWMPWTPVNLSASMNQYLLFLLAMGNWNRDPVLIFGVAEVVRILVLASGIASPTSTLVVPLVDPDPRFGTTNPVRGSLPRSPIPATMTTIAVARRPQAQSNRRRRAEA